MNETMNAPRENPIENDRVAHLTEVFEEKKLPEYLDYVVDRDRWLPFKQHRWIDTAVKQEFPDITTVEKIGVLRRVLP